MDNKQKNGLKNRISRRQILRGMGIVSVGAAAGLAGMGNCIPAGESDSKSTAALRGNINHSLVIWPFQVFGEKWDLDTACRMARDIGCTSVELVDPDGWPTLAKYGLNCAIAPNGMPGEPYVKGLNNPDYHKEVIGRSRC